MSSLDDPDALRTVYRHPHPLIVDKGIDHVDEGAEAFLAAVTLIVVASRGPAGGDASPRGGPPGFVHVVDRNHVAFADLAGNNRLDTYTNIVGDPEVGVLGIVPGLEETLRIRGSARISTDEAIRNAVAIDGRVPKVAVVIEVSECFIHCGKALRRGSLWDPASWPGDVEGLGAEVIRRHAEIDAPAEAIQADLEAGYVATLWESGGVDGPGDVGDADGEA